MKILMHTLVTYQKNQQKKSEANHLDLELSALCSYEIVLFHNSFSKKKYLLKRRLIF